MRANVSAIVYGSFNEYKTSVYFGNFNEPTKLNLPRYFCFVQFFLGKKLLYMDTAETHHSLMFPDSF